MKFNIKKLLQFLDDPDNNIDIIEGEKNGNRGHATSIIGLIGEDLNAAVFKHYRDNKPVILKENVVQGFSGGKWLDRWIVDDEKKILYQCEIKNWAGASLGGRTLPVEASLDLQKDVAQYNLGRLLSFFSLSKEHPTGLTKVLLPMRAPKNFESYPVRPMLILWMLITDDVATMNPHFTIRTLPITDSFSELDIFSVSLYLRQLLGDNVDTIELQTPAIKERLRIINSFVR